MTAHTGVGPSGLVAFILWAAACSGNAELPAPLDVHPDTAANRHGASDPPTLEGSSNLGLGGSTDPEGDAAADGAARDGGTLPPASLGFGRIDIRYLVPADGFVLQCTPSGDSQMVWKTTSSGLDANGRWANPIYAQAPNVNGNCGPLTNGQYAVVFHSLAAGTMSTGAYVCKCSGNGRAEVYRISGLIDGHPAATFAYGENHAGCP